MHELTFDTETFDTNAGEYRIEFEYETDSSNPLTDWDNPGMVFRVDWHSYGGRWSTALDTLSDTGDDTAHAIATWLVSEGRDYNDIERRYKKWRAIAGSPWLLAVGEDMADRSDWYRWVALIDTRQYETYGGNAEKILRATMDTYRQYARGEVIRWVAFAPSGNELESLGGYYDHDDARSAAFDAIMRDAQQRTEETARAGAGFLGIV